VAGGERKEEFKGFIFVIFEYPSKQSIMKQRVSVQ